MEENKDPPQDEPDIDIFPAPPMFIYKQFEAGPNVLDPPNLEVVRQRNHSYCLFGENIRFDKQEPGLEQFGVKELFKRKDLKKNYEKALLRIVFEMHEASIGLFTFLRENPSKVHLKLEDVRLMANNLFYLLNNLRRKQSLLYLEAKLKHQIEMRKSAINKITKKVNELKAICDEQ
ncbi:unnamed protein product [Moneuplotes crassus]|uniref:Mediator of RNA polymerase II transcription subunit 7 n=1 Tax=Euplotes crassus TaxID=5936 RepID=A0AAD1XYS0_EUPCR|nr:unnamed protein product [Moneuplotes crassus]